LKKLIILIVLLCVGCVSGGTDTHGLNGVRLTDVRTDQDYIIQQCDGSTCRIYIVLPDGSIRYGGD